MERSTQCVTVQQKSQLLTPLHRKHAHQRSLKNICSSTHGLMYQSLQNSAVTINFMTFCQLKPGFPAYFMLFGSVLTQLCSHFHQKTHPD